MFWMMRLSQRGRRLRMVDDDDNVVDDNGGGDDERAQ